MDPVLNVMMIYAKDMNRSAAFYQKFFGFLSTGMVVEGLIELRSPNGGANIVLHQAAKSMKGGHAGLKLVFAVPDVEGFKIRSAALGLEFGSTHQANGYSFANAKDPDKNSVCISSRMYRGAEGDH